MIQNNRKNINLGKDYWVIWIDPDINNALDIDELLEPTWVFWQQLETQCVSECCGIYAFSFWPEDIKKAAKSLNTAEFLLDLISLKQVIEISKFHSITSQKLNDTIEKSVFIRIITHVEHSLKGWVN